MSSRSRSAAVAAWLIFAPPLEDTRRRAPPFVVIAALRAPRTLKGIGGGGMGPMDLGGRNRGTEPGRVYFERVHAIGERANGDLPVWTGGVGLLLICV